MVKNKKLQRYISAECREHGCEVVAIDQRKVKHTASVESGGLDAILELESDERVIDILPQFTAAMHLPVAMNVLRNLKYDTLSAATSDLLSNKISSDEYRILAQFYKLGALSE